MRLINEMKRTLVILLFLIVGFVHADEVSLLTLVQTDTKEKTYMSLYLDNSGYIIKLKVKSPDETQYVQETDLDNDGKVLFTKMGVDIISIKSNNLDVKFGGEIILTYLVKYNMFSSSIRKNIVMQLERNEKEWSLFYKDMKVIELLVTPYSKGIKKLKVITEKKNKS